MSEYSLKEALQKFLEGSRLKSGIQALQIQDIWEEIMGKTIARYTDKIQLSGDTLIINTSVAPLKTELVFQREKIRQRINEAFGKEIVKEVVIH
ncbi:MAG: DUF721 domain-containing protein [Chitinophagaceae bacterium]|nr:DUF721 domain-containing protein [Chitinophagaceae bacterium]